jgi:hypothetical protein
MARKVDSQKAAFWKERLGRFETASLTVAEFCAKEGCSRASFYHWRRTLRNGTIPAARTQTKRSEESSEERFRPLAITLSPPRVGIQFPGGTRLELAGEDHELVCAVVREILQGDSPFPRGEV